jgi:hypothetical protein
MQGKSRMAQIAHDMHSASLVQDVGPAAPMPAFAKYSTNAELAARNADALIACIRDFMTTAGLPATASREDLNDYFQAMGRNQAFGMTGTTSGNGTLWLFFLARALKPRVIVESGVYYGSSLFTFRHAAAAQTKIYAFDLNFAALLSRMDGVDYRQHDWGTDNVRAEDPSDLCFFDDHINSCLRLRQSYERGFRHVVIDDSPDIGEMARFRYPAVPSLPMIQDDKWADGDTIEWNWNDRRLRYTFRVADTFGARELVEAILRFPSLKRWTGMEDPLHHYVRLKASI